MTSQSHTGSCLCGAVAYALDGPLRDVVACHCAMCRKTHGHFAAYTAVPKAALELTKLVSKAPLPLNKRAAQKLLDILAQ